MEENSEKRYTIPSNLTPNQRFAVTTTDGPLLIIAGPGSGKTRTLVERTVYLIMEKKVLPETILISTFTEKAARELITRITNRLLEIGVRININDIYIGTLHSIFLKILKEFREFTRLPKTFRMLDQFDQIFFIYQNIESFDKLENSTLLLGPHTLSRWQKAGRVAELIPKVAEELIDHDRLTTSTIPEIRLLGFVYKTYEQLLNDHRAIDFSHIQIETWKLLSKHPDVLAALQNKIHYLMIDEYQDTNTVQEKIILSLLADDRKNICVVGDDDQSLYRFRGATVRNIIEFPNNFSKNECKTIKLVTNFRSHPDIITFYNRWMEQYDWTEGDIRFRHEKTIEPEKKSFPNIQAVQKISAAGEPNSWHAAINNFIDHLKTNGILKNENQIAFLFRSVKHPTVLQLAACFESNGIQVFSPRSNLFFQRDEIKLILGALIYMMPALYEKLKWKDDAHLKIWDYYTTCANYFTQAVRTDGKIHAPMAKWCQLKLRELADMRKAVDYAFSGLFYKLLSFPLFSHYLDVDLNSGLADTRAAYNLGLFSQLLVKFEDLHNITIFTPKNYINVLRRFFNQFFNFLYEGGIEEYEDFEETLPHDCVSFMTIHQAKGLEFPVVFVDSLGAVPRKQFEELDLILQRDFAQKPPFEPIEKTKFFDFYRLYYTAFSRAQNLLILTALEKTGHGKTPSKYFEPAYNDLPQWSPALLDDPNFQLAVPQAANIKNEYSFTSHILLFENCPLQYKFFKELEFAPIRQGAVLFGLLVHQTIEDIHKAIIKNEQHTITASAIESWFGINYANLSKSLNMHLAEIPKQAALKQVQNYAKRSRPHWSRIREAEYDVSFVKDDYILTGTIDLLQGEDEAVEIIDFKSSANKPDINDPKDKTELNRFRRQLETYAHIVEGRSDMKVSKLHLYYTAEEDGNPFITFARDGKSIDATVRSFDRTVAAIESKTYDMSAITKCKKLCGGCDMRYYCNVF